MKKAIIIIPTYNERENIAKVVPILETIFTQIKNWQMHILVVDDSSPDNTAGMVKDLQKQNSNLHLLVNKQKNGLGSAYLKGMDKAFHELGADVVFEFDADLSHDPQRIPAFIAKLDEGYDMVLGSRYIPGGGIPANWGWYRKFLSVVGNIVIMLVLTDFRIRDWTGGYRAITKKVYEAISPEMNTERFAGYTFQLGFLHKTMHRGFKVTEVPFHFADRTIGKSKLGAESIKNTLLYIIKERMKEFLNNRIFKFVIVGGTGALVQLVTLKLWWLFLTYNIASFLSIECAVLLNFILSNLWTFSDRKLTMQQVPAKFVQFNLASAGSILIQLAIAFTGNYLIGAKRAIFTLPIIHFVIVWGLVFSVVGILIGMFWNFFAYSRFVWKKK